MTRKNNAHGFNLAVAQILDRARLDAGLTQEAVARKTERPLTSVQRYLTGKSSIDVEVLDELCRAIGVKPAEVLDHARAQQRLNEELGGGPATPTGDSEREDPPA